MEKTKYYLAYEDGNLVIKSEPHRILMKFDKKSKRWVEDVELSRIYFGDMPTRLITQEEVSKLTGGIL